LAEKAILLAVESLEKGGEEALLSEALTTYGVILLRVGRYREGKRVLEHSNRIAESCGDREGAGRALLILMEEMFDSLEMEERLELQGRMDALLSSSQQVLILEHLRKCHERINNSNLNSNAKLGE